MNTFTYLCINSVEKEGATGDETSSRGDEDDQGMYLHMCDVTTCMHSSCKYIVNYSVSSSNRDIQRMEWQTESS